jgi:hypothetical protein
MIQKSTIHRNFVQMSGYKDVFYNPLTIIKNNPPSPIETSSPNDLIKKCVIREPEFVETAPLPNLINKRKVNCIDKNIIFPSSPEKLSFDKNIKEDNKVFENIKYKMIDTIFHESFEKKIELTNNILLLLKKNNISEEQLYLFLQKL